MLLWLLLSCNEFKLTEETVYIEPAFDVFETTAPQNSVDIVAVVDNSQSMSDNWDKFYEVLPTLTDSISNLESQWRFTVITGDPGKVVPQNWVNQDTQDFEWNVVSLLQNVNDTQGNSERGLDASFTFAFDFPDEFDENSDLHWIFISDENDQSAITENKWQEFFSEYKPLQQHVYASSIVEMGGGCGEYMGTVYSDVSDVSVDLCDVDYSNVISPLINREHQVYETFFLEEIPRIETINVFINATQIYEWDYSEDTNSIKIDTEIPMNAEIIVTYYI